MPTRSLARRTGLAAILVFLLAACEQQESDAVTRDTPPPPVDVAQPVVKEIVEWDIYTGRFEATERVDLRARVSGYLQQVHFEDGEIVEAGQLLFSIDPRPFEARAARARARVAGARAELDFAAKSLARAERLRGGSAVSQELVDNRRTERSASEASLAAAEAELREAALELEFTEIVAPISGRISDRRLDVGNLVTGASADSQPLATIVALDPIFFVFDASEADFLKYARLSRDGTRPSSRDTANPVFVRLIDEEGWFREGRMDFVDNAFNPSSGTIRSRAVFDNPDGFLTPGIFGRLRLLGSGRYRAVLLPDTAIVADQTNRIVYTVDSDGVVGIQRIVIGPIVDGLRVVRGGLTGEERVIVSGLQRARPGGKVTANPVEIAADPGPAD